MGHSRSVCSAEDGHSSCFRFSGRSEPNWEVSNACIKSGLLSVDVYFVHIHSARGILTSPFSSLPRPQFDRSGARRANPHRAWLEGWGLLLSGSEFIISNPLASDFVVPVKSVWSREIPLPCPVPRSTLPLFRVNY